MKSKRQEKILEIIRGEIILTQDELQAALTKAGFNVTQSTVSRDIKELRLVKGHDSSGNYRYISAEKKSTDRQTAEHYKDLISRSVRSIDCAMNDIVIKCYNGMASSVCVAVDEILGDKILGSVAGDDTILIVVRNNEDALKICYELKKMM